MKHKWKIKPRGEKTKYYICERCKLTIVATSIKQANELSSFCFKKE